jgi:hypothetical protein
MRTTANDEVVPLAGMEIAAITQTVAKRWGQFAAY